ncbi:MAG: LamG domain-containing protein [Myxococcales bacterium]|nr:LamG domain-containing protein [Myxococcales bacterium]
MVTRTGTLAVALAVALAGCAGATSDAARPRAPRPSVASEIGPCGSLLGDGAPGHYFSVAYAREDPARAPALTLAEPPFTVEYWFRLAGAQQRTFVGTREGEAQGWRLGVSAAGVSGAVFGGFDHLVTTPLRDDAWHHVAWTYDGRESVLFVDGRVVGRELYRVEVRPSARPIVLAGLHAGADTRGAPGQLDEVRVSRGARYRGPFAPPRRHAVDGETLALWHFDPRAPSRDASALAHPGRIVGPLLSRDDAAPFCERG